MASQPTPEELQDLIDGRLRGERLTEVHAALANDPELAAYVQDLRSNDLELQRFGQQILSDFGTDAKNGAAVPWQTRANGHAGANEDMPSAPSVENARMPERRAPPRLRAVAMAASVLIAVGVGLSGGWWAHQSYQDPRQSMVNRIVGDATSAYAYIGSGLGNGFDFTPEQNDAFGKWSSEAFGVMIQPPDLSEAGFSYAGARVFPTAERTASLLSYKRDSGSVSVYCWRGTSQDVELPSQVRNENYQVRFMTANGLGIAVVGRRDLSDFESAADRIFKAFSDLISAQGSADGTTGATS